MLLNQQEKMQFTQQISPIKVLIADDDLSTRMLLSAAVKQWGYEVVEASDGEQAWELLNSVSPPTLLIIDWLMPKMDGIELIQCIKSQLSFHSYIILLTQVTGSVNIVKALEAGADEFLAKPFNMSELKIRLNVGKSILQYKNTLEEREQQLHLCMTYLLSLEKPVAEDFDMNRLRDIYGNDEQSITNFIKTFITSTLKLITDAEDAMSTHDTMSVKSIFHSIKGSAGNSGALTVYNLSIKAENAVKENDWDLGRRFLQEIKDYLLKVRGEPFFKDNFQPDISLKDKPILVVDDNIINLKLTQIVLKNSGFTVHTAIDAEQALMMVNQYNPALILMDIQMPDKDGLELTRMLKSNPKTKNIIIIALTANAMKGDQEKALEAGCDSYITKPFDTKTLPKLVIDLLKETK